MIKLFSTGTYLIDGKELCSDDLEAIKEFQHKSGAKLLPKEEAKKNTMAYSILQSHNTAGDRENLKIKFDALASHDMTYMGVLQTARASGVAKFPIPFVLTSCHNSVCAVGGTINEDDHVFALSAAKKYGAIYVPPHISVIHQFMREEVAGGGKMILGADSHTRYGALGTLSIGEGAGELVKQLLSKTYDIKYPEVIGVYLTGKPEKGVGPQDVALAIIGAVFKNDYVKNKVMEFVGPGIENLSVDFRNGIDVMTTESACLSTIWRTDSKVRDYLELHGRKGDFMELNPKDIAYYDGMIYLDLSKVKCMIAMPFHPSNTYTIEEVNKNLYDILDKVEKDSSKLIDSKTAKLTLKDKIINNRLYVNQGSISGCSGGTYENICAVADIVEGHSMGNDNFSLSVYPGSQPIYLNLIENGVAARIMATGALVKTAFCGPCIGVVDIPSNNTLSIRHATRNFPNREGSKPGDGQISAVALMDARSIAATAVNNGFLTAATDLDVNYNIPKYYFNRRIYDSRVYYGYNKADENEEIITGPTIADWPEMTEMPDNLFLSVASVIHDPVTTTDELIPSGDTSSYRSNPLKVAEFTLIRKDPEYIERAKHIQKAEKLRLEGKLPFENNHNLEAAFNKIKETYENVNLSNTGFGSLIYAVKPGDGSAREYATSCQKVLGGYANICEEYATKRYRSNLINWGILPFTFKGEPNFKTNDFIFIPNVREVLYQKMLEVDAFVISENKVEKLVLNLHEMTDNELQVLLSGCLINYNKKKM
ncbi:MAG: 3-isopropylmalate dehydratase [Clostridiaceae bacterium]|jgi:aconitate hydratase|nr:3-isopropylmalate dehydratase [Clostridiaceae bacterium]